MLLFLIILRAFYPTDHTAVEMAGSSNYTVQAYNSSEKGVELECVDDGEFNAQELTTMKKIWRKDGQDSFNASNIIFVENNSSIRFTRLAQADSGMYSCCVRSTEDKPYKCFDRSLSVVEYSDEVTALLLRSGNETEDDRNETVWSVMLAQDHLLRAREGDTYFVKLFKESTTDICCELDGSVVQLQTLTNLKNHAGSVEEDVVTICFVLTYSADVHLEQRRRIAMGVREVMVSCFTAISDFSTNRFHLSPETFVTIVIFSVAAVGLLICVSIMFCCTRSKKKPGSPYTRREVICKKGLFALMLARVEEFDTLTPLIVTPTSQPAEPTPQLPRPTLPVRRTASDSPPPPRRSSHGKTLIVPLNASRYRTPVIPLLGTPDSRITSFEGGTTKSCATIPEDDENESPSCERIDDLISIDRTTTSASEQKSHRGFCSHSSYNLILPVAPPEFQIPVPSYSPPSVPLSQSRQRQATRAAHHALSPEEPSPCSNSIGSPNSTGSPIDTTGSISDSFYINSDVISSTNGSQVADENGCAESEIQSKYQLHRIEEESEGMDDGNRAVRTVFSQDSLDRERNFVIPRSISEQFELMRQN